MTAINFCAIFATMAAVATEVDIRTMQALNVLTS